MRQLALAVSVCVVGILGVEQARAAEAACSVSLSFTTEWQLSGGKGQRLPLSNQPGEPGFRVIGQDGDTNRWEAEAPLEPGQLYRLDFMYVWRSGPSTGVVIAGSSDVNRNFPCQQAGLQEPGCIFMTADPLSGRKIHLGQSKTNDMVDMANPILTPVQAVFERFGETELGEGERIEGTQYTFNAPLGGQACNYSRPLSGFTAKFDHDHWLLGDGQTVVYVHRLAGLPQTAAKLRIENRDTGKRGRFTIEVSKNGQSWRELAVAEQPGPIEGDLPANLFPAEAVYVRLKGGDGAVSSVGSYQYTATLEKSMPAMQGATRFAEICSSDPTIQVRVLSMGALRPVDDDAVTIAVTNRGSSARKLTARAGFRAAKVGEGYSIARQDALLAADPTGRSASKPEAVWSAEDQTPATPIELAAGQTAQFKVPVAVSGAQRIAAAVWILSEAGEPIVQNSWRFEVPFFYAADDGELLSAPAQGGALWWTDATRKVPRHRPLPRRQGKAIQLQAAKNEFEAAQLVLSASKDLADVSVKVSDLQGPGGAKISADRVSVCEVAYVSVTSPTDHLGLVDEWPDPLPPIQQPLKIAAGEQQPFWVLVHVPADAATGDYEGRVTVRGAGYDASVALHLHVWDFALPVRPFTHSGFGLSLGTIARYHGLKDDASKREVFAKYMRSFADHRISPYNPVPLDGMEVKFNAQADPPRAEVNFERFDKAMADAMQQYNLTAWVLNIPGMGSGSFSSRKAGELAGFKAGTPECEAMFSSMVKQMEEHLAAKGWLKSAYVYWFDEPEGKDYEFVKAGMDRLHEYAPGIRRMLTEEPQEALYGSVDLWCPISPNFDAKAAAKRRVAGEQFWWYVCTGPKAPYCTLFIDHPATDLRVWLWQTWQRKIEGVLIWDSIYWTSDSAFPDSVQNPYEDPMAYVWGDPGGKQSRWGNGDGRLLYPPRAAAAGSATPVLDGPVSSIRWEMLREGIEDVDYLYLLRAALSKTGRSLDAKSRREAEALLNVPEAITKSATEYTYDPAPIYRQRAAIAEMIVKLNHASIAP